MRTTVCAWCYDTIEKAPDGAWQDIYAKACGCGLAPGGEHEPGEDGPPDRWWEQEAA